MNIDEFDLSHRTDIALKEGYELKTHREWKALARCKRKLRTSQESCKVELNELLEEWRIIVRQYSIAIEASGNWHGWAAYDGLVRNVDKSINALSNCEQNSVDNWEILAQRMENSLTEFARCNTDTINRWREISKTIIEEVSEYNNWQAKFSTAKVAWKNLINTSLKLWEVTIWRKLADDIDEILQTSNDLEHWAERTHLVVSAMEEQESWDEIETWWGFEHRIEELLQVQKNNRELDSNRMPNNFGVISDDDVPF